MKMKLANKRYWLWDLLAVVVIAAGCSFIADSETTFVYPPWQHLLGFRRFSQFHLDLCTRFREKFDDPQGLFCVKLDSKDDPDSDSDDDELTVFGLNSGAGHIIFNKGLFSLDISNGFDGKQKYLKNPYDLTGDPSGNIFVSDTGNGRVTEYRYMDDRFEPVGVISEYMGEGLIKPKGISIKGSKLFVADSGNNRIAVYEAGNEIKESAQIKSDMPDLFGPEALCAVSEYDEYLYYKDFFIAVIDSGGKRLWKIPFSGQNILFRYSDLGKWGRFNHIDSDYYGNIYVTDTVSRMIHKFDRNLNYIVSLGGKPGGLEFEEPRGISIYKRFGQVFISEKSSVQYFWIGTDILDLEVGELLYSRENGRFSVSISFLLTEHSLLSLSLADTETGEEYKVLDDYLFPPGLHKKIIKGRFSERPSLRMGKVKLNAHALPTYSSSGSLDVMKDCPVLNFHSVKNID